VSPRDSLRCDQRQSTTECLQDRERSSLTEIHHAAATTGDDPALDTLLLRLHVETACRRGGALALRPQDLDPDQCLIFLREKGGTVRWQPVSPTLMTHLAQHAAERHAGRHDQLLRYAAGRPITRRRYDHLWTRIGEHVPWVATQQISTHWLRHTTLTWVERNFGYAVAHAYASHTDGAGDGSATSTYVRASVQEVAAALADLTGEPTHSHDPPTEPPRERDRPRVTKWTTFTATYLMNTWEAWGLHGSPPSPAGIVLHSIPPLLVLLAAEAGPGLREQLAHAAAAAARGDLPHIPAALDEPAVREHVAVHEQQSEAVHEPPNSSARQSDLAPRSRDISAPAGRRLLADYLTDARAALTAASAAGQAPAVTPSWCRTVTGCSAGTSVKLAAALRSTTAVTVSS